MAGPNDHSYIANRLLARVHESTGAITAIVSPALLTEAAMEIKRLQERVDGEHKAHEDEANKLMAEIYNLRRDGPAFSPRDMSSPEVVAFNYMRLVERFLKVWQPGEPRSQAAFSAQLMGIVHQAMLDAMAPYQAKLAEKSDHLMRAQVTMRRARDQALGSSE